MEEGAVQRPGGQVLTGEGGNAKAKKYTSSHWY